MDSDFKCNMKRDLRKVAKGGAVAAFMGCFLCLFLNNIAISASSVALTGSMFNQVYMTLSGVVHTLLTGLMCCAFLWVMPAVLSGEPVDRSVPALKSGMASVAVVAAVVEVVVFLVHCALVVFKTGSMDGYWYIAAFYLLCYFFDLVFAGLFMVGLELSDKKRTAVGLCGAVGGVSVFMAMLSLLGNAMYVALGAGADWCQYFRCVSLFGFVNVDSLMSVGTDAMDWMWLLETAIVAAIAVALMYLALRLAQKKDWPAPSEAEAE